MIFNKNNRTPKERFFLTGCLSVLFSFALLSFNATAQNLVTNGDFENGTNNWSSSGTSSAAFTESSGQSGDRLTHYSSSSNYNVKTYQTITGLTAGTYELSAYSVGGNSDDAYIYAENCGGSTVRADVPSIAWGQWSQITLSNINVTSSSCTIGLATENTEWTSFDDVSFELISTSNPTPTPTPQPTAEPTPTPTPSGNNNITVRALGTDGSESITLRVGGSAVQTWTLSTSMQDYTATTTLSGDIEVEFTNDASGLDVQVDYIIVNGETRQAEDQAENSGVWDETCGGGSYSEMMHCDGAINFGSVGSTGGGGNPTPTPQPTSQPTPTPTPQPTQEPNTDSAVGILASHGFNYARIRILVNPPGTHALHQDLDYVIGMAQEAKANGMKILLDFFYSDWWADPGQNYAPDAWANMNISTLESTLYDYTRDTLNSMQNAGVLPDMVQVGNEVNPGMCWDLGRIETNGWGNFVRLTNSGYDAVKSVSNNIPVMIQYAGQGNEATSWYSSYSNNGGKMDILGLSFYEMWHGSINTAVSTINTLYNTYGKDVYLVETAAYWTRSDANESTSYSHSKQGQYDFLYDLTNAVENLNGFKGIFYWGATWSQASRWLNAPDWSNDDAGTRSLFDDNAQLTPAADAMMDAGGLPVMGVDISEAHYAESRGVEYKDL